MRVAVFLGCLVAVMAAPHERNLFTDIFTGLLNPLDQAELHRFTQQMLDVIGTDATEQKCETECTNLLKQGHVLNYACPLTCKSFQKLVNYFHETVPPMQTTTMGTST